MDTLDAVPIVHDPLQTLVSVIDGLACTIHESWPHAQSPDSEYSVSPGLGARIVAGTLLVV